MEPVTIDPMQTGGVLGSIIVTLYTVARLVDHAVIPWAKTRIAQKSATGPTMIRSMSSDPARDCEFDQGMRDKVIGSYAMLDPKDPRSMYNLMAESLKEERKQTDILAEIRQHIDRREQARND